MTRLFKMAIATTLASVAIGAGVAQPTIDTTAIENWCGDTNIRMCGAVVAEYDNNNVIIETEDGNLWEMENFYLEQDSYYLVWFDTKGTVEIEDDEIVKIWEEIN